MAEIQVNRTVPADQETVWGVLSDPTRYEEWLTMHTKWKSEPPKSVEQGAKMSEVLTIMGMPNTIEWTVDDYEAPRSMKISGEGMAGAQVSFTLSVAPDGDGSEVSINATFKSNMMVGAIGKSIERNAGKELDTSLEKFATLVG